jgi:hypothetical protein
VRFNLKIAILRSTQKTQRRVSLEARIPETRLSALVRGRAAPSSAERDALARVLGYPAEQLFA